MLYEYTEREMRDIEKNFFEEGGYLKALPVKPKRKYIALCAFARGLKAGTYTEKAFGEMLDALSDVDAATMRRELVDAELVTRARDGSAYIVEDALAPN